MTKSLFGYCLIQFKLYLILLICLRFILLLIKQLGTDILVASAGTRFSVLQIGLVNGLHIAAVTLADPYEITVYTRTLLDYGQLAEAHAGLNDQRFFPAAQAAAGTDILIDQTAEGELFIHTTITMAKPDVVAGGFDNR